MNIEKPKYLEKGVHDKTWTDIGDINDLPRFFLEDGIKDELFTDKKNDHLYSGTLRNEYAIVGDIRIRQLRSKTFQCSENRISKKNANHICYHDDIGDPSTLED